MIVIFVTGNPCTGRTTTVVALQEYLAEHMPEMKVAIIQKDPVTMRYTESDAALAAYRHVAENSADIIICDGVGHNVFSRKAIITAIDNARNIRPDVDVIYLAIDHKRAEAFSYDHNNDEGHRPYSIKRLRDIMANTQQPIHVEGITMTYNIKKFNYADPAEIFDLFNRYVHMDFKFNIVKPEPVEEEVFEETEEDSTDDVQG